jgi:hypothetical protein
MARSINVLILLMICASSGFWLKALLAEGHGIVFNGGEGPGQGKHIVLVSGDQEYRSEEGLPQLGKILSTHHGFLCTVLFPIDPKSGEIDPNQTSNIPGLEALDSADLMIVALRFLDLPDEQMKHFVDYLEAGNPVIGLRTSTHAFDLKRSQTYSKYNWTNKDKSYENGFGRQVLGETWIRHHGDHGTQSTRGLLAAVQRHHPILRGIKDGDIWGPTDVYAVALPLPENCTPLVMGQVVNGMAFHDAPVEGPKNNPMIPVAWTNSYQSASGKVARVFTTTMGAATDLEAEGTRRMIVNAAYWAAGLEGQIADRSNVTTVGTFQPTCFGHNAFVKGKKPSDYAK